MNSSSNSSKMSQTGVVFICALICCFLWGSAFPCIKTGYSLFAIQAADSASQIVFAGVRFTLAGLLVILFGSLQAAFLNSREEKPAGSSGSSSNVDLKNGSGDGLKDGPKGGKLLLSLRKSLPRRESLPMIVKLCLVQTVAQYVFFYIGLAHTSGVKSSIIGASNVFLSILVAVAVFHMERLTAKKVLGCIVGFAGVVLINLSGGSLDMSFSFLGEGFILLSAVSYAFSSALIKKYSRKENPVTLSGYQFLCGGILLTCFGLVLGGRVDLGQAGPAGWGLLLYMAFISAAAYTLWGILLKYNPVARVAVFGFMNPVFGVLLSALLLGEGGQAFGWSGVAALALVCIGILIVNKE